MVAMLIVVLDYQISVWRTIVCWSCAGMCVKRDLRLPPSGQLASMEDSQCLQQMLQLTRVHHVHGMYGTHIAVH